MGTEWLRAEDGPIRSALKKALVPLRPRLQPGIIVVGAQKSGTSALFKMLALHPAIISPEEKELSFFNQDEHDAQGLDTYLKQLPLRPLRGQGHITLDATPGYLYHPQAAERVFKAFPNAVIVAILRDPVKRAYSDWNMFRQFKDDRKYAHLYDGRTFEEAMRAELATAPHNAPYLGRGYYAEQLERYFSLFPKGKVLVYRIPSSARIRQRSLINYAQQRGWTAWTTTAP